MTSILLVLALYGLTCVLAGMRFVTELRQRREDERLGNDWRLGGYIEDHHLWPRAVNGFNDTTNL